VVSTNLNTGSLCWTEAQLTFADRPYRYAVWGGAGAETGDEALTHGACRQQGDTTVVTGRFANTGIELVQTLRPHGDGLEETLTLKNPRTEAFRLDRLELGFVAALAPRRDWRLCAIPFRVQLDGSVHDYSTDDLERGAFTNATYRDPSRPEPPLVDEGCLRSEAWAWGRADQGLVVIKYNSSAIELSVACPGKQGGEWTLRFGGAGLSLYGEPSCARRIEPGQQVTFGRTLYLPFEGGIERAFARYRDFLDSQGHTFPPDYDPPVNWNELYDVGWYHSDPEQLRRHYTRVALLEEARKAKDCGCELLYLDPGWEVAEGTTLWDESRLGTVADLARTLRDEYGLGLGYRTILRCYTEHWPRRYLVRHSGREPAPIEYGEHKLWELCLCNPELWREKLERIVAISRHGVRFMMFDEMDWRGPCYDPSHGHPVPTTPLDHVRAVYNLCREVRRRCPGLTIEAHDPVWPWFTSIYVPTYFGQGFAETDCYQENWGFEYMWKCIEDLKSGKALALYYYNLGCNIPLYLHITMAADNDNALFFWWAASTVRHLGIGGKQSHPSVEFEGALPSHDPERRFALYREQMALYKRLKGYFVRGTFHGLAQNIHLHTLPSARGGVVVAFNLTESPAELRFRIPLELLHCDAELPVAGADAQWTADAAELGLALDAMSPAVVRIGDAAAL